MIAALGRDGAMVSPFSGSEIGSEADAAVEPDAGPPPIGSPRFVRLVRVSELSVSGLLPWETVHRVALQNVAEIAYCHEGGVAQNPRAEGSFAIHAIISQGSAVGAVPAASTYPVGWVAGCIVKAMRSWRFPEAEGGGIVDVMYRVDLLRAE